MTDSTAFDEVAAALDAIRNDPTILADPIPDVDVLTLFDDLKHSGVVTARGLDVKLLRKRGLTYEEWEALGSYFVTVDDAFRWAIGDWLIFGEATFAEKYSQAMELTGRSRHTLQNYAWVSGAFALSRRRVGALSWSHHEAVASLPAQGQRRYLDLAEREGLSVDALRARRREDEAAAIAAERGEDYEPPERVTVKEAARKVWITAQRDGPDYRVPVETMLALARAIGEPL